MGRARTNGESKCNVLVFGLAERHRGTTRYVDEPRARRNGKSGTPELEPRVSHQTASILPPYFRTKSVRGRISVPKVSRQMLEAGRGKCTLQPAKCCGLPGLRFKGPSKDSRTEHFRHVCVLISTNSWILFVRLISARAGGSASEATLTTLGLGSGNQIALPHFLHVLPTCTTSTFPFYVRSEVPSPATRVRPLSEIYSLKTPTRKNSAKLRPSER